MFGKKEPHLKPDKGITTSHQADTSVKNVPEVALRIKSAENPAVDTINAISGKAAKPRYEFSRPQPAH